MTLLTLLHPPTCLAVRIRAALCICLIVASVIQPDWQASRLSAAAATASCNIILQTLTLERSARVVLSRTTPSGAQALAAGSAALAVAAACRRSALNGLMLGA
jgi:hypothetical protein